jgi:hypothetical protein
VKYLQKLQILQKKFLLDSALSPVIEKRENPNFNQRALKAKTKTFISQMSNS